CSYNRDPVRSDNMTIPNEWRDHAKQLDLQQSEVTFFSTMAYTDEQFVMVNVKAIDQAFPLRGELRLQPAKTKIQSGEIWLSPRAMDLLKVKLGDQLNIADAAFKVTAKIE